MGVGVTAPLANLWLGASTKRLVLKRESRCWFLFNHDRHCSLTKWRFTRNHHLQMMLVAKQHFWECEDGELGSALKPVPRRTSAAEEIHVIKIRWLWQGFMLFQCLLIVLMLLQLARLTKLIQVVSLFAREACRMFSTTFPPPHSRNPPHFSFAFHPPPPHNWSLMS